MSQRTLAASLALAALVAAPALGPLGVARATAGITLTTVSGPSPYGTCTIGGPGTNYPNAEVEPWVDVNPTTVGTTRVNLVGVWQQDRWSNGGSHGLVAGYSSNGGKTWGETPLPFSLCAPGGLAYERASDPWVSFGPDGTAYTIAISFNQSNNDNAVAAATSTDGGKTWSPARIIVNTAQENQTIGNQIVVDPRTGALYDVFDLIISTGSNASSAHGYNVAYVKSTDRGATWTSPHIIASLQSVGVTDPNTGATIRTGDIIPEPAIDPANGTLYVAWQDARFNGGHYDEIALSSSSDGGITWSTPIRVNTPTGRPAFTAAVHVNTAGAVGVSYYDFRYLTTQTTTLPTDYWFTSSTNAGATFGSETHLTGSFDMLTAPYASGYFTGDYEGLTTIGPTFQSFFVDTNSGNTANPTDVVTASVTP